MAGDTMVPAPREQRRRLIRFDTAVPFARDRRRLPEIPAATAASAPEHALSPVPTYEYRCGSCGATFESRRAMAHADSAISCPHGHEDTVRRLSVFAVTSTTAVDSGTRPAGTGCGPGCACVGNSGQGQMG